MFFSRLGRFEGTRKTGGDFLKEDRSEDFLARVEKSRPRAGQETDGRAPKMEEIKNRLSEATKSLHAPLFLLTESHCEWASGNSDLHIPRKSPLTSF